MNRIILSLLFLSLVQISFTQCMLGFEHINTQTGDSAVVIKKYGFPSNTEFRLLQTSASDGITVTIDTTLTSQVNDTLTFGSQADLTGMLNLSALSVTGDTIGYFRANDLSMGMLNGGFPENIGVLSYTPPSTISSDDGEIVFFDSLGVGFLIESGGGSQSSGMVFDTLSAGITDFLHADGFTAWEFRLIIGNPEDWVNIGAGAITCPIGVEIATDQNACDGEAYIGQVQNGVGPYTYDWNGTGSFGTDTTITNLCVGNHSVIIQDQNGDLRTCAFAIGSEDSGYFPPIQSSDTTIHTFTDYCINPDVDSISVIGSEIIDSVSASVVWSFYDGSILIDQLLDTFQFTIPNGNYTSIELHVHLVCNGDTLKTTSSVYSTYGYISLPFTETGNLNIQEVDSDLEVNIYPIPFDKLLNIDVNTSEIEDIIVLNQLGQEIQVDFNIVNKSHLVADFSRLSKGSYVIKLINDKGELIIKKVIKN